MSTPYSSDNQTFSDKGHLCARINCYPEVFKRSDLEFQSTSLAIGEKERVLDGEMALDRIVRVTVKGLNFPLEFIFQERFRMMEFETYQDITITEYNMKTAQKSELYKLNAGLFLYGYYDLKNDKLGDWIVINTARLLLKLSKNEILYSVGSNPRSAQTFFCFKFENLFSAGCVENVNPSWVQRTCINCSHYSNDLRCLYCQGARPVNPRPDNCGNFKKK
jgi:hypothetical protein